MGSRDRNPLQIDRRAAGEYRGEYKVTRNRSQEATEQKRAVRRAAHLCELCETPTQGTVRCRDCAARVEGNTERYQGQGRRGPPERIAADVFDLGTAIEELDKARRGFAAVANAGEQNRRRRTELLIEPRAQADLARRLVDDVLARNPTLVDHLAPIAVEGDHPCDRCGRAALEDSNLCERHHDDQLKRLRKSNAKRRATNRAAGQCAECGTPSQRYRCDRCAKRGEYRGEYNATSGPG